MAEDLLEDGELDLIEAPDEELAAVLSELGADSPANVKVYRAKKGSNKTSFLFECAPHEYSLEFIRDNYGSGDYRVMVREGKRLLGNKMVSVEALPKLPGTLSGGAESDTIKELMRMMVEQGTEHKKDLQTMQAQNQQMMMLMLTKGMQGGGQQQMTPTDMINMVSSMAALFKGNASPTSDPKTIFDMIMQGMTLGRELSGNQNGADTNDLLIKMVDQFGPIFQHALTTPQQMAIGAPQTHGTAQRQALQAPPAVTTSQQQQEGAEMNRLVQGMLRPKLRELAEVAARAGNIDLYTDLVLDQVPMGYVSMLLDKPDPVGFLAEIEPAIVPYRTWFESLLANIAAVLNEDEGLTPDGGDAIHPETGEGEKPAHVAAVVSPGKEPGTEPNG